MKQKIQRMIHESLKALSKEGAIGEISSSDIVIDIPKDERFGDYSSNIALLLSKKEKKPPQEIAKLLVNKIRSIDKEQFLSSVDIAGAGFINFVITPGYKYEIIKTIIKQGKKFGSSTFGRGKKVLLEFVSANPTGPLHVGHGRWAAIGDGLANILKEVGFKVTKEFYINDVGNQIDLLKRSVIARANGSDVPESGYGGSYIIDLAQKIKPRLGAKDLSALLVREMLEEQKQVLGGLGVKFDSWFYESSLYRSNKVQKTIVSLKKVSSTFEEGGALWFKSMELGDDKNRVLIREDGSPTYFASDIAYHADKFKRGFDVLIDIWGTDHHGYVARLKAALCALRLPAEGLKIIIGQLVSLSRAGVPVKMSKRTGDMVELKEVIDEIGRDATRFFFLMLSADSHLDFDLELAKKHTMDNPVYYIQYAHARISSILREAEKSGISAEKSASKADLRLINNKAELALIMKLAAYPDELQAAAETFLPHRMINYARELAAIFHNFYHQHRVVSDDLELSKARLALVFATRIVFRNVLKLLNISAPEQM